jgi:hypothetical protein
MRHYLSIRFLFTLFCLLITMPVMAGVSLLQPGDSLIIECINGNYLTKKELKPTGSQAVTARLTLSLDNTGTVLTVNVQNIALVPDAVLYALDLGLSSKFVRATRMEASFSGFPAGVRWLGPTDAAGPTNGTGTATFATREAMAGRMEDYLQKQTSLSAGFLRVGQGGNITVKFILPAEAKNKPLSVDPVAYFLVNDPNAQNKRIQVASTGVVKAK